MDKADCQTCRVRHLDCNRAQPICQQCSETGQTCLPAFNVRFRRSRKSSAADAGLHSKGRLVFGHKQKWVETPRILTFVHEKPNLFRRRRNDATFHRSNFTAGPLTACTSRISLSDELQLETNLDEYEESSYDLVLDKGILPHASRNFVEPDYTNNEHPWIAQSSTKDDKYASETNESFPRRSHGQSSLYVHRTVKSIVSTKYLELLHYFKTAIGWPWFDVTDPGLTSEALRLTPTCPILFYSMLATASIHKSRRTADRSIRQHLVAEAGRFHERCIGLLLPMLQDKRSITDGAFLTCSTFLRLYEEISAPAYGRDYAKHLLGGYASMEEFGQQVLHLEADSLRNAAFWVHQRQDLVAAVINHRSPGTRFNCVGLDLTFGPADGHTWAKRATCLHSEVVDFCFGSGFKSTEVFYGIMDRLDKWDRCKPDVFTPVCPAEPSSSHDQIFPEVCFTVDFCAIAMAYHYLSMLLLAIYDPRVPRIGPKYLDSQRKLKEQVLSYLRLLCGIAYSNPVPPARIISCIAVSECGCWVTDIREQNAALEILQMVESEDIWPTLDAQVALKSQWARHN